METVLLFHKSIITGEFGKSLRGTQGEALHVVMERVPATLQLTAAALLFSIVLGIPAGVISASQPHSVVDRVGKVFAIAGQSMPVFWVGLLLILLFTVYLGWLPSAGGIDRLGLQGVIMPAISLGWLLSASHMRIVRSSMLDALDTDYVKMARVKGLPQRLVIWKHAFKNAAIPVFTLFAVNFAHLISGAVVTETIFAWPGIGRLLVDSIFRPRLCRGADGGVLRRPGHRRGQSAGRPDVCLDRPAHSGGTLELTAPFPIPA